MSGLKNEYGDGLGDWTMHHCTALAY